MKANIGKIDRAIRIILGLLIGLAGLYFESWLGLLGLIPLLTAFIRWCPLYLSLGIRTNRKN
ncbi:MAG: DUF2892 domain-containing protein [Bacteroidales bacterium]|nr:DUF2892 domain-containing protein [Bacteroidales bacterium]